MVYSPHTWNAGDTITASLLNDLEQGLAGAATNVFVATHYGATGDGATDDTAAIESAITACADAGGGVVLLPAGTYMVRSITLRFGVTIRGDGPETTSLNAISGSTDPGVVQLTSGPIEYAHLENMSIVGAGIANTGQCGVYASSVGDGGTPDHGGWWDGGMRRVRITGFDGPGVWLRANGTAGLLPHQYLVFEQLEVVTAGTSECLLLSGQVGQVAFINGFFDGPGVDNAGTSVRVTRELDDDRVTVLSDSSPYSVAFVQTSFQSNGTGLLVDRSETVSLVGPHFEECGVGIRAEIVAKVTVVGANMQMTGHNTAGTGVAMQSDGTGVIYAYGTTFVGTTDKHFESKVLIDGVYFGGDYTTGPVTSGQTVQTAVQSDNSLPLGEYTTALVNTSTTPIKTIDSTKAPGESIFLRAFTGSIVFDYGGTSPGSIGSSNLTMPLTVPQDSIVHLTKFDLAGDWHVVSVTPPGASATSSPTPNTIVSRDGSGQVAFERVFSESGNPPQYDDELIRHDYITGMPLADSAVATSQWVANTLVRRDANKWFSTAGISGLVDPSSSSDDVAANKGYVDTRAAHARPASTVVIIGDSITNQNTVGTGANDSDPGNPLLVRYRGDGYFTWANIRLSHRLSLLYNAGIGGQTLEQIEARVDTDVIPYAPGFCVVEGGIGSITSLVPLVTMQESLTSIYGKLLTAGIVPIATTVLPAEQANTQQMYDLWVQLNAWIREYAATTPGIVLCDWAAAYADTSGYWPLPSRAVDGTHPSFEGATVLGEALAGVLEPLLPGTPSLVSVAAEAISANPFMTGAGTVADSFAQATISGTTPTYSLLPRADGPPGNWQQIQLTATGQQWLYQNISTGYAVGDTVYVECEFESDNDWSNITVLSLQMTATGTTGETDDSSGDADLTAASRLPLWGVLRTPNLVVPTGTTQLSAFLNFAGDAGTLRVSRFAIRKV